MQMSRILVLLACLIAPLHAHSAEIIVLESTAPGIEAGSIVQDTDSVEVPDGTMILLVEEDGTTRDISGPFIGPVGSAGAAGNGGGLIANLGKLVQDRENKRQVLGAIRTAPGQVPPDLYLIDAARSETVCIPEGLEPRLWRPATMAAETEVRLRMANGSSKSFLWPARKQTAKWPSDVALRDDGNYALRLGIAPRPTELSVRLIPESIKLPTVQAAWMFQAGCRRQAALLIERFGSR